MSSSKELCHQRASLPLTKADCSTSSVNRRSRIQKRPARCALQKLTQWCRERHLLPVAGRLHRQRLRHGARSRLPGPGCCCAAIAGGRGRKSSGDDTAQVCGAQCKHSSRACRDAHACLNMLRSITDTPRPRKGLLAPEHLSTALPQGVCDGAGVLGQGLAVPRQHGLPGDADKPQRRELPPLGRVPSECCAWRQSRLLCALSAMPPPCCKVQSHAIS